MEAMRNVGEQADGTAIRGEGPDEQQGQGTGLMMKAMKAASSVALVQPDSVQSAQCIRSRLCLPVISRPGHGCTSSTRDRKRNGRLTRGADEADEHDGTKGDGQPWCRQQNNG